MANITHWEQVAPQLNGQLDIFSLVILEDDLYGVSGDSGLLLRWDVSLWTQVAAQLNSQTRIHNALVYDNGSGDKIYASTSSGGRLFRSAGGSWTEVAGTLNSQLRIRGLVVYNNKIYGGTWPGGRLFEWNGSNAWVQVAPQYLADSEILTLIEYNGDLLAGTSDENVLKWNDVDDWILVSAGLPGTATGIDDFLIYDSGSGDNLYCTTDGSLWKFDDVSAWTLVGTTIDDQSWTIAEYDGDLYMASVFISITGGKLYVWNDVDTLTEVAAQLNGQNRLYDLTVFKNRLFAGTGRGGRLFRAAPAIGGQIMKIQYS